MAICCQDYGHAQGVGSPFGRIIGTDWYDGLLSGFAECRECRTAYWFSVVGWDFASPERVYALMPLGDGEFDRVLRALEPLGPARWPVWMPIWRSQNTGQQLVAEGQVDAAIANAGPPHYLVSADDLGLSIICSRELQDDADVSAVTEALREGDAQSSADQLSMWLALLHQR